MKAHRAIKKGAKEAGALACGAKVGMHLIGAAMKTGRFLSKPLFFNDAGQGACPSSFSESVPVVWPCRQRRAKCINEIRAQIRMKRRFNQLDFIDGKTPVVAHQAIHAAYSGSKGRRRKAALAQASHSGRGAMGAICMLLIG